MPGVWTKLRASLSPYSHKHVALRMLGWPRAFHGCSVVHIELDHYKKVRSGAMRGLRAERKGANPVLHLPIHHLSGDPEAWVILQTIRDARELGGLARVESMLGLYASAEQLPRNGPTAVLFERLTKLGWTVGGNGLVQDSLGNFSLMCVGWDELLLRFSLAWGHVMAQAVQHRSSFQGLQHVDLAELRVALRPYGPADLVVLRCHLDGTLFTQNARAKFQPGVTSQCPWCDQTDGFFHRAWSCPFFEDCRAHVTESQRAVVEQLPECLSAHGWPVVLPEWEVLSALLLRPQMSNQSPVCPMSVASPEWLDVFVDGTAAHPKEPKLRFAAWAATLAVGGIGRLQHRVLLGGHVAGLNQSAYRAELTAVLAAVRWAKQHDVSVRIWSDCLAVVRRVRALLQGNRVRANCSHSDLWLQLEDILREWGAGRIAMVKVVSHADVTKAVDPIEEWAYWHNRLVDEAAAHINQQRPAEFWEAWRRLSDALTFHRQLHRAILEVLLRTGRKAMNEQQRPPPFRPVAEPAPAESVGTSPAEWKLPTKMFARHGSANVQALHRWWTAVGGRAMGSEGELVYVSGLQLFLDFYLVTGHRGPWVCKKKWFDTALAAPEEARTTWGSRTKAFLMLFQTYLKAHKVNLSKKVTRPSSGAISHWLVSYRLRYPIARLREIDSVLFHHAGRQLTSAGDIRTFTPYQMEAA